MIKFARFILSNLFTLLLSLILAFLIWINASQTEDPIQERWLQIPVEYVGQPEDSILLSAQRRNVQIFFEGPASIVSELNAGAFSAIVDLSQAPFGEEVTVPIQVQSKNPNATVLSQPEPVTTLLEQLVTVEIPVELDIRGEVARGHVQGDPLIDPEFISVSGPASRVQILDRARATVFLNNDRESIVEQTQPIFYDRQGRVASVSGLSLSTDQLEVTIPVNEAANYAEKFIALDLVGEPASGYRLLGAKVEPLSVLIQGRPTQLNAITQVRTEPVDITGLTESFRQQVSLVLPDGITLDEVVEVFVEIEIEPFLTTRPYNQTVVVQGLAENMTASVEPENVRVVLFGPLPALETLVDEEVRVTVDLFDLDAGIYSLEPAVNFPERGIELRSVQPSLVTVNVTRSITLTEKITETIPLTETSSSLWRPDTLGGHSAESNGSLISAYLPVSPIYIPRRNYS